MSTPARARPAAATAPGDPAFGQADLTNCEREQIHLAGSVQPHGALLLLREADTVVLQASANAAVLLGVASVQALLMQPLAALGGDLGRQVAALSGTLGPTPQPLHALAPGGRRLAGSAHRPPGGGIVLELEAADAGAAPPELALRLEAAVQRLATAGSLPTLADAVVQELRALTGHDRVMVYRFDPDGHGKIIAEARHQRLAPLLGHHYPASDIPHRARQLYLKNRVRLLVDVHAAPQPLQPALRPDTGAPLDMSMCALRSMSPLHLQYLKNMGVCATLVASLVRDGRLWGLIAAHHDSPHGPPPAVRAAAGVLAEVASTRIAALESEAHAQVAAMVQRLQQRLLQATSADGDWKQALLRNARALLQPLEATGAALFHGDEVLATGDVPGTAALRALCRWVDAQGAAQPAISPFTCSSVGRAHPPLAALAPGVCGVMAVRLSATRPDYLMWFRPEQLRDITWAGDPAKPMVDDDPLTLSPRRSFAAWTQIVQGTAVPWSEAECVMARAVGAALADLIVQVHAVRLLIAEHQLGQIRAAIGSSREPVLLADADGGLLFANEAFHALLGPHAAAALRGMPVCDLFSDGPCVRRRFDGLALQPWRGEWALRVPGGAEGGTELPVTVRAEAVPGHDGAMLGFVLTLTDLRDARRTARARAELQAALQASLHQGAGADDAVLQAICDNTCAAAARLADADGSPPVAPLLDELGASARRAAALYAQVRSAAP